MEPLAHRDVLLTLAEVAAAFVGFSMIVAALRSQPGPAGARFHSVRDVAEIGIYVVAGSLLPLLIHAFELSSAQVWRYSSAVVLVVWLLGFAFAQIRFRRSEAGFAMLRAWPFWGVASILLTGCGNGVLVWNVISPTGRAGPRYLLALVLLLMIAGGLFINATFRQRTDPSPLRG